jgi:tRNA threonylcarbamoyladenosine biosynthesis protein TsaE
MIWQILSTSSAETERLGGLLGSGLKGGEVVELRSDLGGGKTTFVRGLVGGSGSKDNVTSPTFTLSRIYNAKNFTIHHFDFYRLNDSGILADQLSESFNDRKAVVVIEWANIVKDILPEQRLSIEFKPTMIAYTPKYRELITAVQTDWTQVEP